MVRLNVDMKSSIGEIADRFGLPTHVLRHWESMGLLAPARSGGQRRYTEYDLYRIAAILRAKQAGLSLDQIRQMITARRGERRTILREQRDELRRRIAAAQAALELIDGAMSCRHEDFTQCPHYRQLVTERIGGEAPPHRH